MTTWVLLRGLAREQGHWGRFATLLQQRVPAGDTVVAVDLPGNGERWREASPMDVPAMLGSVHDTLRSRGCDGPAIVIALSLGGMVAMQWAAVAPQELRACVLINSSAADFSPFWARLRPGSWPGLLRGLWRTSAQAREAAVFAATSNLPVDEETIAAWAAIAQARPVARRNVAKQLWAAARYRAPAALPVPTLLLASRGDRLVAPSCSAALARAWQVPLVEHPWAGHDLPLDDPLWVVDAVLRWLPGGAS
jgi:pimeloyl-ACP methyl ester carboxylesterase